MKCPNCGLTAIPEKTQYLEVSGVITKFHCPGCKTFFNAERNAFHKQYGFRSIKEILEERKRSANNL